MKPFEFGDVIQIADPVLHPAWASAYFLVLWDVEHTTRVLQIEGDVIGLWNDRVNGDLFKKVEFD